MATSNLNTLIKHRSDTAANWTINNSVILHKGEIGFESDTGKMKIGNGTSTWAQLDYFIPSTAINSLISTAISGKLDSSSYLAPTDGISMKTYNLNDEDEGEEPDYKTLPEFYDYMEETLDQILTLQPDIYAYILYTMLEGLSPEGDLMDDKDSWFGLSSGVNGNAPVKISLFKSWLQKYYEQQIYNNYNIFRMLTMCTPISFGSIDVNQWTHLITFSGDGTTTDFNFTTPMLPTFFSSLGSIYIDNSLVTSGYDITTSSESHSAPWDVTLSFTSAPSAGTDNIIINLPYQYPILNNGEEFSPNVVYSDMVSGDMGMYFPIFGYVPLTLGTFVGRNFGYVPNATFITQKSKKFLNAEGDWIKPIETISQTITFAANGTTATLSNSAITASNTVICGAAPGQSMRDWTELDVYCSNQVSGQLTFTALSPPTESTTITVNVIIINV